MKRYFAIRSIAVTALCIYSLSLLAGCSGHKVLARVKDMSITDADLADRALLLDFTAMEPYLQRDKSVDVGSMAMIELVRENMVKLLAKEKGAVPSDEDVKKVVAYNLKLSSALAKRVKEGQVDQKQLETGVVLELMSFGIGTDNAKAEDKDLDAEMKQFIVPESYTLRSLSFPDKMMASQALAELRLKPDFIAVAKKYLHVPDASLASIGKEQELPLSANLPADLRTSLQATATGTFVAAPIPLQAQGQSLFVIALVVKKIPSYTPTKDEIRPLLSQAALNKSHPEWKTHFMQQLAEFTDKLMKGNEIVVNNEKYKAIVNAFIAQQVAARLSGPTGSSPMGGGSPPPSTPQGGAPPPASGSTPSGAATPPASSAPTMGNPAATPGAAGGK